MIVLTRLNGSTFAVNPDLIERIQENPDTSIVLVDGTTFIVQESTGEIVDAVASYRARVIALAHSYNFDGPQAPRTAPRLGIVDSSGQVGTGRKGTR
ncbi:flagellar FlbD family protein [Naasia lichenicola]|uniref:Flagellar protein FlbD n=1 Tax=Naasia lichenicola TaxID=2565933 RepID=A0A4S4FIL3_9MICO|nr:flagellar FlbD family protein [Naasia lichenicola]THG29682.1 hypothetical protein E6C64_13515 [Naasia lichenicola]